MKKEFTLFASLLSLMFTTGFAQSDRPLELFKNMTMRSIGPAVTSGRVTAIDVQEGPKEVIYAGTASGGLWRSESGGVNWTPLFDDQPLSSIGSFKIDPQNPDVLWVGTGEGNPRNSQTSGAGMYKSLDAGKTWKLCGLEATKTIHRICINPKNSEVVYAAAHGSAWGPNAERGVYRTKDGGRKWEKVLYINDTTGCADLVMDPNNSNKLFAAMYHYYRKPWYFHSGGKGSGLHLTLDGGDTWKQITSKDGLPEGELGRIGIAIAPSNSKIVYALIEAEKTGLYKSNDGGFTWKLITNNQVGDRPFYYHELYVDPKNENHLIYLHSTVTESIDGGKTWTTLLPYYGVHPDHHAFWWSKNNPQYMIEGNDGGLNISRDGGENWLFAANLPVGQFYHIHYDMQIPYNVYGGMQDNGSWIGPAYIFREGGIRDADWQEILFGDGFDVVPNKENPRYVYAMWQGGNLMEVDTETGHNRYIRPTHPTGENLRFNWNAAIAQDPFAGCGLYYGSQYLHHSTDCGNSWQIISPDLTTNDTTKQIAHTSGGLTTDATDAENHCTIISIAPSPLDKNIIWVGTDDGNVQLTQDAGKTWKNLSSTIIGLPKNCWIAQIVASAHNSAEAFVVANNYRLNDWKPYLFYTNNFGKTWKNLADPKNISGHCLSVAQDHIEPKLLFLGTENGLYVSFDFGNKWHKWTYNYPSVPTQDLQIHPRENDLIIGTFGRAAFILDDIGPLRKYAQIGEQIKLKELMAMTSPTAYQAGYLRPRGQRFIADGTFEGQNKAGGAVLTYCYHPPSEIKADNSKASAQANGKTKNNSSEKKAEVKKGNSDKKVNIHILTLSGDTVRTLKHEPDTGINKVYWRFDSHGPNYPSRRERKTDIEKPGGGMEVPPGTYKVIYKWNDISDSTTLEVAYDPRLKFDKDAFEQRSKLHQQMTQTIERANQGFENLKEAKKNIELIKTTISYVPDSTKKKIVERADSLAAKIKQLEELYFLPEDAVGIQDDSKKLISYLYTPMQYLDAGRMEPGENVINSIRIAEKKTDDVITSVNKFFETEWSFWQELVNGIDKPLFKPIKRVD